MSRSEQKDPQRKHERRNERAKAAGSAPSRLDEISVDADAPTSRRIFAAVRGLVSERAGYRCEFEGPDGVRCSERTGLEVDHIRPFSRDGTHHESNLRLLCGAHNRGCAERELGVEFIRDRIDRARSGEAWGPRIGERARSRSGESGFCWEEASG